MRKIPAGFLVSTYLFMVKTSFSGPMPSDSPFFYGCVLPADPWEVSPPLFSLCQKLAVSADILIPSGADTPEMRTSGTWYNGLHLSTYGSLHWQGQLRSHHAPANSDIPVKVDRYTRYFGLHLGNPAMHRFRLALGAVDPAFGIRNESLGAFFDANRPDNFWLGPPHGFRLTFDNLTSLVVEAGMHTTRLLQKKSHTEAQSFRVMHDGAAWGGTRTYLSLFAGSDGERRYGLGVINTAPDQTVSQIEWIRIRTTPNGKRDPFLQLLRIYLMSGIRNGKKTFFLYDDLRHTHRTGILGQQIYLNQHFYLKTAVSFKKDESPDRHHQWHYIIGAGGSL